MRVQGLVITVLFFILCSSFSGCASSEEGPMSGQQGVFGRQQTEEVETNAVRPIEDAEVEKLNITPYGEMASDPWQVENGVGYGVTLLGCAVYENPGEYGLNRDQLFSDGGGPKPSSAGPEEGRYFLRDLVDEEGNLLDGFQFLVLDAEVANLKTEGRDDSETLNLAGVVLTRPEEIVVVEEEDLVESGVKYSSSDDAVYWMVYLSNSMAGEKNGYTVAVLPGESCRVQIGYLVPEDMSDLIGIVSSSGHYSGGFFSLKPEP